MINRLVFSVVPGVGRTHSSVLVQMGDGSPCFNRSWREFKDGFELGHCFWLGNERLHNLTTASRCVLRFDVQRVADGKWYWAEYDSTTIDTEVNGYAIHAGAYSGTAGDAVSNCGAWGNINNFAFGTYDRPDPYACYASRNLVSGSVVAIVLESTATIRGELQFIRLVAPS